MMVEERTFCRLIYDLGGGFDFIFDDYNKLAVTAEVTKLLVPTPPIIRCRDMNLIRNGDGEHMTR